VSDSADTFSANLSSLAKETNIAFVDLLLLLFDLSSHT